DVLRVWLRTIGRPSVGLEVLIGVVFKEGSMYGVGPALDRDVHGAATGALFGIEGISRDAYTLDRFQRRNELGHVKSSHIKRAGTIDSDAVAALGSAVDAERQSAV